jgi:hypothetical protein
MMSGVMLKTAIYGLLRVSFDLVCSRSGGGAWWPWRSACHRRLRRALQHRAERHEAPARLFLDREHRPARRGHGTDFDLPCLPHGGAGGAGHDGAALPLPGPRRLQEPAVPVHRLGAARDAGAQPGQARRPHPPHALGGLAGAGRRHRQRRPAAALRLRLGMAAAAGIPVLARACRIPGSTWWCRWPPRWWRWWRRWRASPWSSSTASSSSARCASRRSRTPTMPVPWERVGLVWLALITLVLGILPSTVISFIDAATRQLLGTGLADKVQRARLVDAGADLARARQLRAADLPRHHRHCGAARPPSWCAASTTAACAARRRGTAAMSSRARARRTPPRASASRSAASSSRCSAWSATSRPPATRSRTTASRSRTISGTGSTCRWRAWSTGISALITVALQGGRIAIYLLYSFLTLIVLSDWWRRP